MHKIDSKIRICNLKSTFKASWLLGASLAAFNSIVTLYSSQGTIGRPLATVEPLNNGHFGTSNFWHNFTVIERLSSFRGKIILPWSYRDHKICPL